MTFNKGELLLNRIFVREESDQEYGMGKSRYKIGVAGVGKKAGTSLVATSLAKELSKNKTRRTAFVEIPAYEEGKSYIYDSLGMDKRFAGKIFFDFYEEIQEGKNIKELVNLDERINWALDVPQKYKTHQKLKNIELCHLINNITADQVICDMSEIVSMDSVIKEMDLIVAVIDPLPSKLIGAYPQLCYLKKCQLDGQPVIWVVNKYNEGINKRELNGFIKIKNYIKIPLIPLEQLYSAEYSCKLPYSVKSIAEVLRQPVAEIVHKFNT